jgi:quercetin dioxygenase-like cupin family protein
MQRIDVSKTVVPETGGMGMTETQHFVDRDAAGWITVEFLPGVTLLPLAEPVKDGSIHRARMVRGTVIPVHTHPADEYVMVLSGTVETGGRRCAAGTFWITPAGTKQGPHVAVTDAELLTVRLGAMGPFGEQP